MKLISTNPSNNYEVIGDVIVTSEEELASYIASARRAQKPWADMGVKKRVEILRNVAERFEENAERIVQLAAQEMGMPVKTAREDFAGSMEFWNAFLDTAERTLQPVTTFENEQEVHELHRVPRGVTACIIPWNFPFGNFVWQCGQNLAAGNVIVFKHSEESPLCGKLIDELLNAELPEGVFSGVYGGKEVGKLLVEQDVDFICFTGSTAAGQQIAEGAGSRLIPTSSELGGSAPGIVFDDADISSIVENIFWLRFLNSGQACDGLKRLIVHADKYDEMLQALSKVVQTKKLGDASKEDTDLGPLVSKRQLELLASQVSDATAKGATVVVGGKRPEGLNGAYYEPTILTNITKDMRVWQEEVFGPVLPIVSFKTEKEAIELANDTVYGLGGYIFTLDSDRFKRIAMSLDTCMISQNNLSYIRPENFFGGQKQSGSGREHGPEGFHEVTMSKQIAYEK